MAEKKQHTSDPAEWTQIYGDYLYSYALSRVYRKELAEDLVQETFLSALKSKDSFQGRSKEQTWLTSILKNKIIDHYRKVGNSREKMILDQKWKVSGEESPFQQVGADQANSNLLESTSMGSGAEVRSEIMDFNAPNIFHNGSTSFLFNIKTG